MKIKIKLFGFELYSSVHRVKKQYTETISNPEIVENAKLNFGPGKNWIKPGSDWYSVDIDPELGDVVVDFQKFETLPFKNNSIHCVYGSHVFEHISIFKSQIVFNEIYRVLKPGGVFRLILPDAEKSIKEYLNGNQEFLLFKRRKERAKKLRNIDYSLFECMKEDFLSPAGQIDLLGENTLAHQNAWDFDTIKKDLNRAGFESQNIEKTEYMKSRINAFSFEGKYPSEADEYYRSLYVEAVK
jgi:predicted SAM-dependent methyltransferase